MGLKEGASATYLQIVGGKLAKRVKVKTAKSVTRQLKEGYGTVEEEYFKSLEGIIVGLDTKAHKDFGETLLVYIKDDSMYCIQMSLNGRYASNFLKTLPNVDLKKPVEFVPSYKKDAEGKEDMTVFLKQDDKALPRFYTKDSGHGLPEPIVKKGKRGQPDKYDFTDVNEFLYENVIEPFRDALKESSKKHGVPEAKEEAPAPPAATPSAATEGTDDLPF